MPFSPSPGLLRHLQKRKLEVLTLTLFYDRMLRAKDICTGTLEASVRWKEEDIGLERLSKLYVPQRATVQRNSDEEAVDDSSAFVSSWLRTSGGGVIFILADAGRGKTWLTWSLAYDAAKKYLDAVSAPHASQSPLPPIPFLIPFSQYKRLTSFNGIILERLNSLGTLDIRAEGFKYLLSKGRIVLILDGFDEMLELAPAHARENLLEIRRHLQGSSKLVLTSRRTVFPTKNEISDFIGVSGADSNGLELSVCSLQGFSSEQIVVFHKARGALQAELDTILKLPVDKELHQSPQIAEYFLDIVREKIPLNHQGVFETILSLIYKRESAKWEKEGSPPMPGELQEQFLTEIALVMWPGGSETPELVQLLADDLGHRYLAKHHLLQPTLDGQLQFEHHVWRDWFMTRALRARIAEAGWAARVLSNFLADPLPEYCATLLAVSVERANVESALKDLALSDAAFSNLLRIAILQIPRGASPSERARQLRQYVGSPSALRHRHLQRVRFELFDFRDWSFEGTIFSHVVLTFCTLPRGFEQALRHSRGLQIVDCTWWPEPPVGDKTFREAREHLGEVLRRFVMSTEPLRVRDEIQKEKMTRDFRISDKDKALRCLIKAGYICVVLQAASEKYYVLEKKNLDELVRFMSEGIGLDHVVRCIAE
ncbi:MAG: NACHT domain-containing protein [Terriglobia bacterium]